MADDVYVEHEPFEQSTYRYCTEVLVKFQRRMISMKG